MKRLILLFAFALSGFAQTSFPIKVGSEPTVTVSLSADAVTSITSAIQNIIAGPPPTTLAVAATAADTVLHLTSAAGITAGMGLKIETEIAGVASVSVNDVTVVRGQVGSTAAAHLISVPVLSLRSGLYGEFIANLVLDAVRNSMLSYPAATIASANATIATAQATIASTQAAGGSHVP
jgi:hypothetical protein